MSDHSDDPEANPTPTGPSPALGRSRSALSIGCSPLMLVRLVGGHCTGPPIGMHGLTAPLRGAKAKGTKAPNDALRDFRAELTPANRILLPTPSHAKGREGPSVARLAPFLPTYYALPE